MVSRLAAVAAAFVSLQAGAYELRKDATGAVVRWQQRVTFTVDQKLGTLLRAPGAEGAVRLALRAVAAASPGLTVETTTGAFEALGYAPSAGARNHNDITGLEDWPYQEGALAATLVTLNRTTHEIVDADIVFNLEQHRFRVLPGGDGEHDRDDHDTRFDDVQNTLTHELGHALGLMHNLSDVRVVMYPAAAPGETSKRQLAADDQAGLVALYEATLPGTAAEPLPTGGCSATSSGPGLFSALVFALGMLRRGQRSGVDVGRRTGLGAKTGGRRSLLTAGALLVLPATAIAEDLKALDLSTADVVTVVEVVAAQASRPTGEPGLIVTDLHLRSRTCLKGACARELRLRVPGGTVGDFTQVVVDHPVPLVGDPVAIVRQRGHDRLVRLDSPAARARFDAAARRLSLPPGHASPTPPP